jgi:hypothetical protein
VLVHGRDYSCYRAGGMRAFFMSAEWPLLSCLCCVPPILFMSTKRDNHESMAQKVEKRLVDAHLREGETVCMANINPFALLFAPEFHPELRAKFHYKIQELYGPGDCDGVRPLP